MNERQARETIDVFISYAQVDRNWREDVAKNLRNEGFDPIYDENSSELGTNWRTTLRATVDACQAMVVLFSSVSVKSTWVLYECIYALATKKRVVMIVEEGVTIPDPISDIQGVILTSRNHFQQMQQVVEAIRGVPRQKVKPNSRAINDRASTAFIEALIQRYSRLVAEQETVPDIEEFDKTLKELQESTINRQKYVYMIETEIEKNGSQLLNPEVANNANSFREFHRLQAILGELLSQLLLDQMHFFQWTDPITVGGKTIIASKYLLTRGLYFVTFGNGVANGMDGTGALPHVTKLNFMAQHSPLEESVNVEVIEPMKVKIREQLHTNKIDVKSVRLPTTNEWVALAQPKKDSLWNEPILRACNLQRYLTQATKLSVVGSFPASCSRLGCFDVLGNAWELCCEPTGDWRVMGFSHRNTVGDVKDWTKPRALEGMPLGDPVAFRFVAEL